MYLINRFALKNSKMLKAYQKFSKNITNEHSLLHKYILELEIVTLDLKKENKHFAFQFWLYSLTFFVFITDINIRIF